MKPILIAAILNLACITVFGQTIQYEKTYTNALRRASAEKKLVFLMLDVPPHPTRTTNSGLTLPDVVAKYNQAFVCFKLLITDTAYTKLRSKYSSNVMPAYFFVDKYANLVYKDSKNSALSQKYLNMADSALTKAASGNTLTDYDIRYSLGNADATFLKEYITAREALGVYDNAKLIEDYVSKMPAEPEDPYQEALFILKAGPLVYGKAYSTAYQDRKIIDSIFKTEPKAVRSAFNSRIKTNTYNEAVAKKDELLAQRLSTFIRNIYRSAGFRIAGRESERNMVNFYLAVKDTTDYLRSAAFFYDSYYMTISADSVKKLEYIRRQNIATALHPNTIAADSAKHIVTTQNIVVPIETINAVAAPEETSTILNNAAYAIYQTGTQNTRYLNRTLAWVNRAIELTPGRAAYYDTLAHLLYRSGKYEDAAYDEDMAVDMASKEKQEQQLIHLKEEQEKIKKHKL